MVVNIIKKCPKCKSKAVRLYQNKTVDGKRKWILVAWYCTFCSYTYRVASDTLIYGIGGEKYEDSFKEKCPKCNDRLVRLYRRYWSEKEKHRWTSMSWYCQRCKYIWLDKKFKITLG